MRVQRFRVRFVVNPEPLNLEPLNGYVSGIVPIP
jgi:hypothetical protein